MSKSTFSTPLILLVSVLAIVGLTYVGCNTDKKEDSTEVTDTASHGGDDHAGHDHDGHDHGDVETEGDAALNAKIDELLIQINDDMQKGGMPKGILAMRDLLEQHPNNTRMLEHMGILAMNTGQYKKAVERFEKLVSLHPDAEEFAISLAEAKSKLQVQQRSKK